MPPVKDFFVSYNKADRTWAEWIAWQLEEAGSSTVLQAWDFRPGGNFVLDMQQAAAEAERTIAVLSPDYLTSRFAQPEWAAAFAQDPTGEQQMLVPVRVRACDLQGLLPQIVYIDLVGRDEASAKEALLHGVRRGRAKPPIAPAFPGGDRSVAQHPPFPQSPPPPPAPARVDKRTLREAIIAAFSLEELTVLCADVERDLVAAGVTTVPVSLDMVGGQGKTARVLELIEYLDRRGYLDYLVNNARQARPGRV